MNIEMGTWYIMTVRHGPVGHGQYRRELLEYFCIGVGRGGAPTFGLTQISRHHQGPSSFAHTMGFAIRVRSVGQKYGPTCHQRDCADVTEFVTLVQLSSLGQHVDQGSKLSFLGSGQPDHQFWRSGGPASILVVQWSFSPILTKLHSTVYIITSWRKGRN